ncbi:putative NADPH:adrenodoxin oxidoreductase, mitochondrial [Cucumispora dikerogammari]|nr:putative NADPH:adrenodoxin oxidoreductase, mitochondrial [Cucumispora dikerogammari]
MSNIAIIGGGPAALMLIKSLQSKTKSNKTENNITISLYEKSSRLLDFFHKYFSDDSDSKNLDKILLKGIDDNVSLYLNTDIHLRSVEKICKENLFTDVVFAIGMKEKPPLLSNQESALNVLEKLKTDVKYKNTLHNAKVAIIGCGNVTMDLTRALVKVGADKIYSLCRSGWETAKFTNSELIKTVNYLDGDFSTKNFHNSRRGEVENNETNNKISAILTKASLKRRETFLSKFQDLGQLKNNKFSIFFRTSIKEISEEKNNQKYTITTNNNDIIKVDKIISAIGFNPIDISPYVNIIESMSNPPRIHQLGGCKNGATRIDEISREADVLSEKLINLCNPSLN